MTTLPTPISKPVRAGFTRRQHDLLLLNIFVLLHHGHADRAAVLADAMHVMGDRSPEIVLARAVLRFREGQWAAALRYLEDLDRIAPVERFGAYKLTQRQRMRRYLKTRCLFELGEHARARDALDVYLRHGSSDGEAAE